MTETEIIQASKTQPSASDKNTLLLRLDELLEQYLITLDRYQKAQQQLTTHLASGFLSLAQANFSNSSHTHYGQDYYDGRMQALRIVHLEIEPTVAFKAVKTDVTAAPKPKSEEANAAEESEALEEEAAASNSETPTSDQEEPPKDTSNSSTSTDAGDASATVRKEHRDPLRWFGILVPPSLRSTQSSFVAAVETTVPDMASLVNELRKQEIDIGRLRKQIRKL
ncbi:hypothetical protein M011DRAFT_473564 [Sporormia fimetaria CBS 119925]|uniref:Vacuolar ATPase assembly protein VMA22 n=1 Tax=Sporormia fimetaria CBS 119925 TaxID=1340428 RepID=A0A6A6VRB5_9PLEO|nr:hypothetical protein M011DRAFT_473564 [Sporormia fimetaria CBS 119925]